MRLVYFEMDVVTGQYDGALLTKEWFRPTRTRHRGLGMFLGIERCLPTCSSCCLAR